MRTLLGLLIVLQIVTVPIGMMAAWDWHWIGAVPLGGVIGAIPVVGGIAAMFAAPAAWGWSMWLAALVFVAPYVLAMTYGFTRGRRMRGLTE